MIQEKTCKNLYKAEIQLFVSFILYCCARFTGFEILEVLQVLTSQTDVTDP